MCEMRFLFCLYDVDIVRSIIFFNVKLVFSFYYNSLGIIISISLMWFLLFYRRLHVIRTFWCTKKRRWNEKWGCNKTFVKLLKNLYVFSISILSSFSHFFVNLVYFSVTWCITCAIYIVKHLYNSILSTTISFLEPS